MSFICSYIYVHLFDYTVTMLAAKITITSTDLELVIKLHSYIINKQPLAEKRHFDKFSSLSSSLSCRPSIMCCTPLSPIVLSEMSRLFSLVFLSTISLMFPSPVFNKQQDY